MAVALENLDTLPALLPIPKLNSHVIGGSQNEWLCRVDGDGPNIVRVCFERGDLLRGVVIVNTELEVIRTTNNPVLSRDKATGADRDIGKFEGLDDRL